MCGPLHSRRVTRRGSEKKQLTIAQAKHRLFEGVFVLERILLTLRARLGRLGRLDRLRRLLGSRHRSRRNVVIGRLLERIRLLREQRATTPTTGTGFVLPSVGFLAGASPALAYVEMIIEPIPCCCKTRHPSGKQGACRRRSSRRCRKRFPKYQRPSSSRASYPSYPC